MRVASALGGGENDPSASPLARLALDCREEARADARPRMALPTTTAMKTHSGPR